MLPKILIEAVLVLIFVQDIKERSVYWILFPVLTLVFLGARLFHGGSGTGMWQAIVINMMLLVFQFLIVSTYFSVKNKKWTNITSGLLGWGDLLFLLSLCFYLSVLNFLLFYIFSLILVLVIWLVWQFLTKEINKHVPLAGLQALIFAVFSGVCWWVWPLNLTNDDWLLKVLYK